MVQLYGIAVTEDSLSGVPWLKPLDCGSCRVTLARTSVDSLRTGSPEVGFIATLLIGVIAVFLGSCIGTEGECFSGGAT